MRKYPIEAVNKEFRMPAILVTYNVLEEYALADRILIYSNRRVVQARPPQLVFNNPIKDEVLSLKNLINFTQIIESLPEVL